MTPPNTETSTYAIHWSGCSDTGKVRKNNEDAFLGIQFNAQEVHRLGKFGDAKIDSFDCVFAVSDGMGGAKAGELASQIATEKITSLLPRTFKQSAVGLDAGFADVMTELFDQIHRALKFVGRSYEECREMQTTLSLCWFTPGWMYFGHIGDTRIYHCPAGERSLRQLTNDDTHVGWLLRNGKITEAEARRHPRRNVLQRALGGSNQFVDPQVGAVGYERGDRFLLCTDGITDSLSNHRLMWEVRPDADPGVKAESARSLVDIAIDINGRDNTTALIVEIG
jgi:serine/threonine protein phosphatase PrpC